MGIYIFKSNVLVDLLHENEDHFGEDAGPDTHFGHDVIPHALREGFSVRAHHFDGYWRVGPFPLPEINPFHKRKCSLIQFDHNKLVIWLLSHTPL